MQHRVTSLEQLSLAEFSGELVRPKDYENNHKNVLGIWINLEWKVNNSAILVLLKMGPIFDLRVTINPNYGNIFMVLFMDI